MYNGYDMTICKNDEALVGALGDRSNWESGRVMPRMPIQQAAREEYGSPLGITVAAMIMCCIARAEGCWL